MARTLFVSRGFRSFLALGTVWLGACQGSPGGGDTDTGSGSSSTGGSDTGSSTGEPLACPAPTAGPTMHSGDVVDGEIWTADASPHIVEYDVTIREGRTLTIEPCAEVQIAAGQQIEVAYPSTPNMGTLIAEGTETQPITFTRRDGEPWGSIAVHAPGTARLAYVTLQGGGGGDFQNGASLDVHGDGVDGADELVFVDHVTIRDSVGVGAWLQSGAAFTEGSQELVIEGSGDDENPYPLQIEEPAIDTLPSGSYTGNAVDEILLDPVGGEVAGSGLVEDATMRNRGVPYRIGNSSVDSFIIGGRDDNALVTLTIEAGVVLRFAPEGPLRIQHFTTEEPANGALRALGTAEEPIIFTSAAETPAAGDWQGLWYGGIPRDTNVLDHVRIEYAGSDCSCTLNTCSNIEEHEGGVIFTGQPPSAFITNSVFSNIAGHGITQGFDGTLVNFRPTNTFEDVSGCAQTRPRNPDTTCPDPLPMCDEDSV